MLCRFDKGYYTSKLQEKEPFPRIIPTNEMTIVRKKVVVIALVVSLDFVSRPSGLKLGRMNRG